MDGAEAGLAQPMDPAGVWMFSPRIKKAPLLKPRALFGQSQPLFNANGPRVPFQGLIDARHEHIT